MLTGLEIRHLVRRGVLKIDPFNESQLNPNSYNLTLSEDILIYKKMLPIHEWMEKERLAIEADPSFRFSQEDYLVTARSTMPYSIPLDMAAEEEVVSLKIPKEGMVVYPGVLYLGATVEKTSTPFHIPMIEGRSSVGRLGLFVHVTAGFGDIGFGHLHSERDKNPGSTWTLEITPVYPIRIYAGVQVCQIGYELPTGHHDSYKGKYNEQTGPKPSGLWKELKKKDDN